MSIEVRVPKEIKEYKEKIIFGLSIRQLVCLVIAIVLSIGAYFLCTRAFKMTMDVTSYVIILISIPLMAVGFIKKNGFTFEKYFALIIRHKLGKQVRSYKNELLIDQIRTNKEGGKDAKPTERKIKSNAKEGRKEKRAKRKIRECEVYTVTKKDRSRKGKITKRKIKTARQEYRRQKRRAEKAAKKASAA